MLTLKGSTVAALQGLAQKPRQLRIAGDDFEELMKLPRIAIVGSRKVSPYGRGVTEMLTSYLASRGVVIVSGLALGVDSIAHQACLDTGGKTIAVLPAGLERIYPSTHTNLAHSILNNGGALVTEYDEDMEPYPGNFLQRNRIIAALSEAVIVTEAAARSGSLNTANHALELGKPVFAVPGNITSPLSAGCNNLIKAGAIPVTSPEDILNNLGWEATDNKRVVTGNNKEERLILQLLRSGLSDGAELLSQSGLDTGMFNRTVTMLEITGCIHPIGANHWTL